MLTYTADTGLHKLNRNRSH